jgi:hypothetical protein
VPNLLSLDDHILNLDRFDSKEQDLKDLIHARLQDRTEVDFGTGCTIYTGAWEENGQAKMRVGRRVYSITRVSAWLYLRGFQLWDVRRVVHKPCCPNPACYAQDHLVVLADQAEALAAQMRSGRLGERHHCRLNKLKAAHIRELAAEGVTPAEMAHMPEFDCSVQAIRAVIEGRRWK